MNDSAGEAHHMAPLGLAYGWRSRAPRRSEHRRTAAMLEERRDKVKRHVQKATQACCDCAKRNGYEGCQRCSSHLWFFAVCCGHILLSSLPRILVMIDFVYTILVYVFGLHFSKVDPSLSTKFTNDVTRFTYTHSLFDVLIISIVRSAILFFTFAYRHQKAAWAINVSLTTAGTSLFYLLFKLIFSDAQFTSLIGVSIGFILAETLTFLVLRRRRILVPEHAAKDKHYRRLEEIASPMNAAEAPSQDIVRDKHDSLRLHYSSIYHYEGLQIHYAYEKKGPATLMLFHGFGAGSFSWKRSWNHLATFTSILAFDRPGFALSSKPGTKDGIPRSTDAKGNDVYSSSFSAVLALHLLDELEIQEVSLVAHSTGASAALRLAELYPERVKAVILISPSSGMPPFIRTIVNTSFGRAVVLKMIRSEVGTVALRRAWFDEDEVPDAVMDRYEEAIEIPHGGEAIIEMTRGKAPRLTHRLAAVQCPVVILHGAQDKLVPLVESTKLQDQFDVEVRTIDECGHMFHEEFPREFAEHVVDILVKQRVMEMTQEMDSFFNEGASPSSVRTPVRLSPMDFV